MFEVLIEQFKIGIINILFVFNFRIFMTRKDKFSSIQKDKFISRNGESSQNFKEVYKRRINSNKDL